MARLQAKLRERETIQTSAADPPRFRRTSVQLPHGLFEQTKDRAKRDERTVSQVIQAALERYLAPR